MPRFEYYSSYDLSEGDLFKWKVHARKGAAYAIPGVLPEETIYLRKYINDTDPELSEQINRLHLQHLNKILKGVRGRVGSGRG